MKTPMQPPEKLRKLKTLPTIISAVVEGLCTVWAEVPKCKSSRKPPDTQDAIESQNRIGWWAMISGGWSLHWKNIQQKRSKMTSSPRSPQRWQASVTQLSWNTAWDLWDFCNDVKHGTRNNNTETQTMSLNTETTKQWRLGAPAIFEKQCYQGTLHSLLQQSEEHKTMWLQCVRMAHRTLSKMR